MVLFGGALLILSLNDIRTGISAFGFRSRENSYIMRDIDEAKFKQAQLLNFGFSFLTITGGIGLIRFARRQQRLS